MITSKSINNLANQKMETMSVTMYLFLLALPAGFWQCTSSSGKEKEQKTVDADDIRRFNTMLVQPGEIEHKLNMTGRVAPLQKIDIIAQVQGIARPTTKLFKEGVVFQAGQVMVSIEDAEFRNNLTASKSQFLSSLVRIMSDLKIDYPSDFQHWNTYLSKLDVTQPLEELPKVEDAQLRYFLSANNIFDQYYAIKSQEEILDRYVIRAPFTGAVTQAFADPGGLVRPGARLGEFIRTDQYEVQAAVSAGDIHRVRPGQVIELSSKTVKGKWRGKVTRIGKSVDPSTQSVSVYLSVKGNDLKEGMYLEGKLGSDSYKNAVEIPKSILTRKNQVYIIKDSVVWLKSVTPLEFRDQTVIVQGLDANDGLITDPILSPVQGIIALPK